MPLKVRTMKTTKFFLVAFLLVVVSIAHGQIMPRLGVKAGMNTATIKGIANADNLRNFHAGGFLSMKIIVVGLQGEALFSRVGATLENGQTVQQDYLQFPVVAKLYLIPGLLNLQGGIQYSVLLNANYESGDVSANFKNGDLAVPLGLELEILNRLQLTGRYIFGVSDIKSAEPSNIPGVGSDPLKSQLVQVSLGWKFGGKKN